jgi:UDP-3-O-[3-hydroxymyristoyl] glucosamine N-acyltransferase
MNKIVKILFFISILFSFQNLIAQTQPSGILFQAVARDASNNAAANRTIYAIVEIREATSTGSTVYSESHQVLSNDEGIFNLIIGNGTRLSGATKFDNLNWRSQIYFINLKVAIAPSLPTPGWDLSKEYVDMGTSQIWAVPYAFSAFKAVIADSATKFGGVLAGESGGTGINNTGKTITLGRNFEIQGLGNLKFNTTGLTSLTLPQNGRLINTDGIDTLLNKFIVSPMLLGKPLAPTADSLSNDSTVANIKYVKANISKQFEVLKNQFSSSIDSSSELRLKISDTSAMLTNRIKRDTSFLLQKKDTITLSNRIDELRSSTTSGANLKVNISDTSVMLSNRFERDTISLSNRINTKVNTLNARIDSSLYVNGKVRIDSVLNLNDSLRVIGNVLIDSNLTIKGILSIDGGFNFRDSLTVTRGARIDSSMILKGKLLLGDSLIANGSAKIDNNLQVGQRTRLNDSLTVMGVTRLNDSLTVNGRTRINDSLLVRGNTKIDNNLLVSQRTRLNDSLTVMGVTRLNDSLTVNGRTRINDSLLVRGNVKIDSNLIIGGKLTVASGLDFRDSLTVTRGARIDSSLLLKGKLLLGDSLIANGSAKIDNNLLVGQRTRLNDSLTVMGVTRLNDSLTVNGRTRINDSLLVRGNVKIDSNLIIGGKLTVASGLDFRDSLTVTRGARIDSSLLLKGKLLITDSLIAKNAIKVDGNILVKGLNVSDSILRFSDSIAKFSVTKLNAADTASLSNRIGTLSSGSNKFTADLTVNYGGGSFGKYTNGQTIPAAGKTIDEVFRDILTKVIHPSYSSPTASLTMPASGLVPSGTAASGNIEIGTNLGTLTFNPSFNKLDGGDYTSITYKKNGGNLGSSTDNVSQLTTQISYQVTYAYGAGTSVKKNNLNEDDVTNQVQAGSVNSNTVTITPASYKYWGMTTNSSANITDADIIAMVGGNKEWATSKLKSSFTITGPGVAGPVKYAFYAVPNATSGTITSITAGGFESIAAFDKVTRNFTNAQGYVVSYDIYVQKNSGTDNVTLIIQ